MRSVSIRKVVAGAASALTAGAVALALMNPGMVTQEVDLHDGGVWVTNQAMRLVGHLNYSSQVIDSALRTQSVGFDVEQAGANVFVSDQDADTFTQVDVTTSELGAPLAEASQMELGGDRLGYADAKEGKVWVTPASEYAGFDPATAAPVIGGEPGVVLAMGQDGSVHAASSSTRHVVTLTRAGSMEDRDVQTLTSLRRGAAIEVTAVGDKTVVLDKDSGTLFLPDGSTSRVKGSGLHLQMPGPEADEVLVATDRSLVRVAMDGSQETLAKQGAPGDAVRPAMHLGCAYAAWSGHGAVLRDCPGSGRDTAQKARVLDAADSLTFRENRTVIVLNNMEDGGLWLPDDNMRPVDNWDEVNSQLEEKEKEDEQTTQDDAQEDQRPQENTPPQAVDDEFGVRPGRSAWLPVMWNDTDPDGDVLTVEPKSQPAFGQVAAVSAGAGLQARIDDNAAGTSSFTYVLSDGRAQDEANVALTVHPWSMNDGPKQLRESSLVVGQEAKVSTNVSGDWIDPDGDPVFLQSVSSTQTLQVSWKADGTVTVQDLGSPVGTVDLTVTYSDGRESTDGVLHVEVRGGENIAPVANGDHVVVQEGQTTELDPRANDSDANGDQLRVAALGEVPQGITAELDPVLSTVKITGRNAGSYYVEYVLTDGPASARGLIRVDVVAQGQQAPPVTQDDVATLPEGGQTLVGVLDNDSDPAGGVLVLQSVTVPEGSGLVASVVDHHVLRVSAPRGLSQTQELSYTVANAAGTSQGRVLVIPAPAVSTTEPPVLADDVLTVRAGDIASVSVLSNDVSPGGLSMSLQPALQHAIPKDVAVPFVSGNRVRVRAGTRPGAGVIIYTVRDSAGNVGSAKVQLSVVPADDVSNQAPRPREVTAWAVAGQKITVPIPLEGIDPDGDSVTLEGLESSPRLGVAQVEETSLTYIPGATSNGTDVFSYTVRDRLGASASATVRVGVAPAASSNQRPVAVADQVQVRPGMRVVVPVLDNDLDPDGDELTLVAKSVSSQDKAVAAQAVRNKVRVSAPQKEGTYVVSYEVTDSRSEPVAGMLSVVVAKTAPKRAPIARDDAVTTRQALEESEVRLPVLDNDSDPDGDVADDTLTSSDKGVSVGKDGTLRIAIQPTERYVLYTLTDPDNLSSSALVYVPGSAVTMPKIDPKAAARLTVKAGEKVTIPLDKYVLVREGRSPSLTDASKVSAAVGWDGSSLVKDSHTLVFGADPQYSGPSSVTFEVTDGSGPADRSAKTIMLTLPITVLPGDVNRPPTLRPTAIEVAAGEPAVSIDMARWVEDPDDGDLKAMRYRLAGGVKGIDATVSGSMLRVAAASTTKRGQAGSLTVEVEDSAGHKVSTAVPVTVVASRKPLMQVAPISVTIHAGKSQTVDLARYVTNPFPATPVSLVGAPTVTGKVSVQSAGTKLTVTAPAGTNGTSAISFRLADETQDPEREVTGRVEVTVLDRPDAPTSVSAVSDAPGTASVSWTAGAANGSPITGFTVVDETQRDSKTCGVVTTCLIDKRTNGKDHTFHVIAVNEVGESEPSAKTTVNIDVVPGTVPKPHGKPGDHQATFTWDAPVNEGSPITSYTVYLSGPSSSSQTVKGTSATFTGLRNGAAYTVTVIAENAKGTSKEVSVASDPVTPYGAPSFKGTVSAVAESVSMDSGTVIVSWPSLDPNGKSLTDLTVTVSGAALTRTVAASDYRTTFTGVPTGMQTFTATVSNGEQSSSPLTVTVDVRSDAPPTPNVNGARVEPTGRDSEVKVSGVHPVPGAGWSAASQHIEVRANGGTWVPLGSDGVANVGVNALVTVEARSVAGDRASEPVTVGQASPYGPPAIGSLTCEPHGYGQVTCYWEGADGRGKALTSLTVSGPGSGTPTGTDRSGSFVRSGLRAGEEVKICLAAVQEGGAKSRSVCAYPTVSTPAYTLEPGGSRAASSEALILGRAADDDADDNSVAEEGYYLSVSVKDARPGSTLTCTGRVGTHTFSTSQLLTGLNEPYVLKSWTVDGTPNQPLGAVKNFDWEKDAGLRCTFN